MSTKELLIRALEENLTHGKNIPKKTLLNTGCKVPEIEGDINGESINLTLGYGFDGTDKAVISSQV